MNASDRLAIAWLAAQRDPETGLWWSWQGPSGDAYPYEEATAWVVLLAAALRGRPEAAPLVRAAEAGVEALAGCARARGGLGRAGRVYAFDTAVGMAALQAWGGAEVALGQLSAGLEAMIARREAVEGGPAQGEERAQTRWSEAWGGHMIWLAVPLLRAGRRDLAELLAEEIGARCRRDDGLLAIHGASREVYAHATAYGAEGWLALGRRREAVAVVRALLAAPTRSGLVPARPGARGGAERTDVTAQVLRIAARCQADPQDPGLQRARRALDEAAHPRGGLRYEAGAEDRTSWSTVFALAAGLCPDAW